MSEYKYGMYGHINNTVAQAAVASTSAAVYIGTSPINLIRGYATKKLVNEPVKLTNITAQRVIGYSSDWSKFTLSEVIKAHFSNPKGNVGPVHVINILDPDVHRTAEAEHELTFVNGEAVVTTDTIILDTFAIENKVEGTDYELSYDFNTGKLTVRSLGETPLTGTVACTYRDVDLTQITASVFRGSKSDGVYTGAYVIEKLYPFYGIVPQYIAAPGFTNDPANYKALCDLAYQVNNHWFGFVYADLPIMDGSTPIVTMDDVKAYRLANGYTESNSKIYWPMAKIDNDIYHVSTLAVVEKLRVDQELKHPCGTDGNKTVAVTSLYFGEDIEKVYDQEDGNILAQEGIATVVAWAGRFKLWGDHTAAYMYSREDVLDKRLIFDANVIMLNYTLNQFQLRYENQIDQNINKAVKDTITHDFQEWLKSLVADGALIGNPQVEFLEENNPSDEISKGRFVWNIFQTNTPLFKAGEAYASYTDAGIVEEFGEEGE